MVARAYRDSRQSFRLLPETSLIRLAEKLAKYLCSLMRRAETLATPERECLLCATYWFRPILSELIGAATESAILAWFPVTWASKVAQCFIDDAGGATQLPQEVTIQCPNREAAGTQRDDGDQVLQAVKFTDKKVLGSTLTLLKISKLLAASRKSFVATKWGLWSQMSRPSARRSDQSHA